MTFKRAYLFSTSLLVGVFLIAPGVQAQPKPLLQEGKKSLYQRVLTTPDCALHQQIGDADAKPIPAFSRYYIYDRTDSNGQSWVHVGPDTKGNLAGWLQEGCTVEWKMQLTLAFSNPANSSPVLFFENRDQLEQLVDSEMPAMAIEPIMAELEQNGQASGVVAKEPELAVDQQRNFYLLPIFLISSEAISRFFCSLF